MEAAFIRHKMSSTKDILNELWEKRIIAVHYKDCYSTNPKDYDSAGEKALTRLHDYCEEGRIVGATYRDIKPEMMLVGTINPGTEIKAIPYPYNDKKEYIYKTVKLQDVIEVPYRDYPLLSAIQPIGATVTGWPSAKPYLNALLGYEEFEPSVYTLLPAQLEIVCLENLRFKGILKASLIRVGKTIPDIDIYGIDEAGNSIVAQVTYSKSKSTIRRKSIQLEKFGEDQ